MCPSDAALKRPAAGLAAELLHRDHHGLRLVDTKPKEHIRPGWIFSEDTSSSRSGRRMYKQKQIALKDIMYETHVPAGYGAHLQNHGKKQPDIPEDVRHRLYGIPGQNIFTYGLDEPRACRAPVTNFDVCLDTFYESKLQIGMIPKESVQHVESTIPRVNIAMISSLEESLLPKEEPPRRNSKQLYVRANESHIEPGYVTADEPVKTVRLYPLRHNTNLESDLLPIVESQGSTRRHYSCTNAHGYDCMLY
ncbi:uncharacterized protein BXIN_0115 [Babesia sp. Xinjiang]|uniref:uncharacterized protein n=1 Tax=Babesia sp. Xinjiang TaxID=462227 RepID=UPI000A22B201|nr:uncharacterized protein BXIN_0115 [Babesia sp. Xinjiang]ORM39677.1 hypothetical protein BXIN_0115 [Babesia sp. Xinjiang]